MMNRRKWHITISVAGLAAVLALLVYYLMNAHLWKIPVHLGFAVLTGLLVWRLVQGIRAADDEEENRE